jgi:hypothetical protein
MRYLTRIQGIQREGSQQLYVTVPSALVQALGLSKGQEVAWASGRDSELLLQRLQPQAPPHQLIQPNRPEAPLPLSARPKGLLDCLQRLLVCCRGAFAKSEQFERSAAHLLSQLICLGRHTITALLCCLDLQDLDWTSHYRHYAQGRAHPEAFFALSRQQVQKHLKQGQPLVIAVDDSLLRRSGRKVHGGRYQRDPLSPPFHTNLVRGVRVVQLSAAWPYGEGEARMIPVDFCTAPLPAKPHPKADDQAWQTYKAEKAKANINLVAHQRVHQLTQFYHNRWQAEAGKHPLMLVVDGRLTNQTFLRGLPAGLTVIGRIRHDTALFHPPQPRPKTRGAKRRYGEPAPKPEALLRDDSVRWKKVKVRFAGRKLTFRCKRLKKVLCRLNGGQQPVQVIVIAPVRYRAPSGKEICRRPAYLLCTNPQLPLEEALQYYFWRWDIEVNFRDEKTALGVGQAQVRTPRSTEQAPALAVAGYSLLLLASLEAYGPEGQPQGIRLPKWRRNKSPRRATTNRLVNQLRLELWAEAIERSNFADFIHATSPEQKSQKLIPDLSASLLQANR